MSRSLTNSNQYIIECLNNRIKLEDRSIEPLDITRTIKLSKSDKRFIKNAKHLSNKKLLSQDQSACFSYEDEYYFIYVGTEENISNNSPNTEDEHFVRLPEDEITPGWTVLVIFELKVTIKYFVTGLKIYNDLGDIDDSYYNSESCKTIRKYFEDFHVYKIKPESILLERLIPGPDKQLIPDLEISRVLLVYFLNYNSVNNLSFEPKTIDSFYRVAYEGDPSIPFENILDSYMSFSWKYSFLDIYRCLEGLFRIPQILKLYQNISVDLNFLEFIDKIEESISWKPKEEDALKSLFAVINNKFIAYPETYKNFKSVQTRISPDYSDKTQDAVVIYSLRNKIVHFNSRKRKVELKEPDWDKVISFCLLSTYLLYEEYGEFLTLDLVVQEESK